MKRKYGWTNGSEMTPTETALAAIRDFFDARNQEYAIHKKRIVLKKRLIDIQANGDMVYEVSHCGYAVLMTKRNHDVIVNYTAS